MPTISSVSPVAYQPVTKTGFTTFTAEMVSAPQSHRQPGSADAPHEKPQERSLTSKALIGVLGTALAASGLLFLAKKGQAIIPKEGEKFFKSRQFIQKYSEKIVKLKDSVKNWIVGLKNKVSKSKDVPVETSVRSQTKSNLSENKQRMFELKTGRANRSLKQTRMQNGHSRLNK